MRTLARLSLLVIGAAQWLSPLSEAAPREFPYEAVVRTAEVDVRSGPGQRYYVTSRLKMNDKVRVHRHDPGGWYMIAPPAGSFSWIDASLVRRTEGDRGIVEVASPGSGPATRAIVRIGSEFSNDHSYYGRELASGDEVTILGEATLQTDNGAARMLKISPPSLEYRWVKGDFIVAENIAMDSTIAGAGPSGVSTALFSDSSTVRKDSQVVGTSYEFEARTTARPAPRANAAPATSWQPPTAPVNNLAKLRMAEIDQRYVEMIRLPVEQWNLDALWQEYESLKSQADPLLSRQIDSRMEALDARRKIANEWREFIELTTATTQRDMQLASMQAIGGGNGQTMMPTVPQAPMNPQTPQVGQAPQPFPLQVPPQFMSQGAASGAMLMNGVSGAFDVPQDAAHGPSDIQQVGFDAPATPSAEDSSPVVPRLDGAGVIQRQATGRRGYVAYVLTDMQGRVLAMLQPEQGVQLEAHVGRPAGVIGPRTHYPQQGMDIINVRRIVPVQLSPEQLPQP